MIDPYKKEWRERKGQPYHDGDCLYWDKSICTCGLLHHLKWIHPTPNWALNQIGSQYWAMGEGLTRWQRRACILIMWIRVNTGRMKCWFLGHKKQEVIPGLSCCNRCVRTWQKE